MKKCYRCQELKELSEFNKNRSQKDGYATWCRKCKNEVDNNIYHRDKEKNKDKRKKFYIKNKNLIKEYKKVYYINNKDFVNKQNNKNKVKRLREDSTYRLIHNIRRSTIRYLKQGQKSDHTTNLIGCNIDFLKAWLNITALANGYKEFDIKNYSGQEYHIDHKIPCAVFHLECSYHQKLCFNWNNLQILTKEKNQEKGDKICQ